MLITSSLRAQQKESYEMKIAGYNDSLVAVDAGLPLVDSADDRPTFTLDGRMMIFGSERFSRDKWRSPSSMPGRKYDSDIWYRKLSDSGWSVPINLGEAVNDAGSQMNPTVHPRGDIIYYMRNGTNDRVWQAKLFEGKFIDPKPVPGEINRLYQSRNTAVFLYQNHTRNTVLAEMNRDSSLIELKQRAPDAWDVHFKERVNKRVNTWGKVEFWQNYFRCEHAIFPDGHGVVFAENFGQDSTPKEEKYGLGGKGWGDLWFASITPNGSWDSVKYLSGNLNTEYNETYPFIAADGATLYFTSNRPCAGCPKGTSGMEDIYISRLSDNGWSEPKPLGPPFNSPRSDYGFSIGPDGETAYFVSNRAGPSKLYQVKLRNQDSAIKPLPVMVLQGRVYDLLTGLPVKAEIYVDNLSEEKPKFSVTSDSISGSYVLAAQRGSRYGVQAIAEGYMPRSDRFEVPRSGIFDRTKIDIGLAPVKVAQAVELRNVYFEFGKSVLLPESKLELDRIVQFLKEKGKSIRVEIQGHTDEVGSDSFNLKLSKARAESVMKYLRSKGVNKAIMTAKGYGKERPVDLSGTEEAQAKNRRVQMEIKSM